MTRLLEMRISANASFEYSDTKLCIYSGAPYSYRKEKEVDFLLVIKASGITCGRVRTTATSRNMLPDESRNMAAMLLNNILG